VNKTMTLENHCIWACKLLYTRNTVIFSYSVFTVWVCRWP